MSHPRRSPFPLVAALGALAALSACTTVDVARLPDTRARGAVLVTQQDLRGPYESIGPVQVTRRGSTLVAGLVDPAGLKLQPAIDDLVVEARRAGADAVINVRYDRTQHSLGTRILFGILFFLPLPGEVTVTGELVRLRAPAAETAR